MPRNELKRDIYFCDTETTIDVSPDGTQKGRVYHWCIMNIDKTFIKIGYDVASLINMIKELKGEMYVYNLRFDGSYLFSYLMLELNYRQQSIKEKEYIFKNGKKIPIFQKLGNEEFKISKEGASFYNLIINKLVIKDFANFVAGGVNKVGSTFANGMQKIDDYDYQSFRPVGYAPTKEEEEYLINDVDIIRIGYINFFNELKNETTNFLQSIKLTKEKINHIINNIPKKLTTPSISYSIFQASVPK